jgi:hypothetical protein
MATLTGQKIKDTYDGLLKTQDSTQGIPSIGTVYIQDGLGNDSALKIGRAGNGIESDSDLTVFGETSLNASLQVDGEAFFDSDLRANGETYINGEIQITGELTQDSPSTFDANVNCTQTLSINRITDSNGTPAIDKFVTEAEQIDNNDNDTSLATSAAIVDYVSRNSGNNVTLTGMVNNLASQGSGGYDYMEWTSNATPEGQVPAIIMLQDLKLVKVGLVWLGQNALNLTGSEKVEFSLRKLSAGQSSQIANYTTLGTLFHIDTNDDASFPHRVITLTTPINVNAGDIIACVGQETGTVLPNNGELAITFLFENQ